MKHLHCTTCKFTLEVGNSEEAKAYTANMPMHCGQPMVADSSAASVPATPEHKEEALPKEEKKGFFGGLGKKKKKG